HALGTAGVCADARDVPRAKRAVADLASLRFRPYSTLSMPPFASLPALQRSRADACGVIAIKATAADFACSRRCRSILHVDSYPVGSLSGCSRTCWGIFI